MSRTVWIQANQLGRDNSALAELLHPAAALPASQVLMVEAPDRSTAVRYHRRKLVLLFSAMRHFAEELRRRKITVDYYPLQQDDGHAHRTLDDALALHLQKFSPAEFTVMEPPDLGTREATMALLRKSGTPFRILRNSAMLTDRETFAAENRHRKQLLMNPHYRFLRTQFRLLVEGDRPVGGRWMIDARGRRPVNRGAIPRPLSFLPDAITSDVMHTVDALFPDHPGAASGFDLPVTHAQAIALADDFIAHRLPFFSEHREAMLSGEPFLYHSCFSPFLNIGLLSPLHLLKKIEHAYHTGAAPLSATECFVRQVLGWREFLYGAYHTLMPEYRISNHLNARARLPGFFWNGETDLQCLAETIGLALRTGYLHHAQRLMIIGNFATLTGVHPPDLLDWCMSLFLDASEWVTLPSVLGAGTFADGGRIVSRPSAFPGRSIEKRSDYCGHCRYSVRAQTGPEACPFNYLYWDFLDRNHSRLSGNSRLALPYRTLQSRSAAELRDIRLSAGRFQSLLR